MKKTLDIDAKLLRDANTAAEPSRIQRPCIAVCKLW